MFICYCDAMWNVGSKLCLRGAQARERSFPVVVTHNKTVERVKKKKKNSEEDNGYQAQVSVLHCSCQLLN